MESFKTLFVQSNNLLSYQILSNVASNSFLLQGKHAYLDVSNVYVCTCVCMCVCGCVLSSLFPNLLCHIQFSPYGLDSSASK